MNKLIRYFSKLCNEEYITKTIRKQENSNVICYITKVHHVKRYNNLIMVIK